MFKYLKSVLIVLIFSAMLFTGCNKNKAPDKPSTPTGPTSGSKNSEYTFASSAEDPDEDDVAIRFTWGDGDTSDWSDWQASEDSISMSHSWSDSGSYSIRAQAQDLKEAVSSWSSSHQITIGATIANNPPNTPITPIGDSIGSINVSYSFISTATDPEEDSIAIRFIWGDGDTSDWSDWQASEDSVSMDHAWSDTGTYNIKAQAKDKKDTTSEWSAGHSIKISSGGWIKTFGGSADDRGWSVQPTTDGGYIITGSTKSFGAVNNDVYLIKTDGNGNQQWYKTFGGSGVDDGFTVRQTSPDRGYIITGHTNSYGQAYQVYLIKTDSSGNESWHLIFGGNNDDGSQSVQQTLDGGYIITGWTNSYGQGDYDVFLIKTNANGDTMWRRTFGYTAVESGRSVQQTLDGGYIITGYTNSFGNGYDVYLIRTNEDGHETWYKTFGGSSDDWGRSVQQTSDRGYIITGSTKSFGSGEEVYLIKTDSSGEKIWDIHFGGSGDDCGYSVQETIDGYIITGYTTSPDSGKNVYLIKTDANGIKQWEKTFGGSVDDCGYSVQRQYDSNYIITGYTKSSGAGGEDVYLIKTDANGNVK